jgi:hypothetical protein
MALAVYAYLETALPPLGSLGWAGVLCNRLLCLGSRRKGSET